ncbi:phosphatidate cytidylyltransferase [Shimia sp.]|uniref:phosphatidate cytidylyltransferase n=1 Tax=Shimia sp. TaxID=1954381 RepID=UPI003566801A
MSAAGGRWADLLPRVLSAVVMLVVGVGAVWAGGLWFRALVALVGGGMIWELARMMAPGRAAIPVPLGLLSAAAIYATALLPGQAVLPVLLAPAVVGASQVARGRLVFVAYAAALLLACFGLIVLRDMRGVQWLIWLAGVVVATDVAGYFVGRVVGGPKFWPKVSPKKTWSGIVAGWIAAACVGAALGGAPLILLSVLTSFLSQMGDAAESAIKRRCGVKDSSNLIPGHGGLLDRFDAMMGAALFVLLVGAVLGLPAWS